MIKKYLYFFEKLTIFAIIFSSCTHTRIAKTIEREEEGMITDKTFTLYPNKHFIPAASLSEMIADVKYIPLETSDSSAISTPINVKYENDIFYVSDIDERLYCFDKNGQFLRAAYKKGKGHGEVVRMYDFDVNSEYLYILDGSKSAIVKYDHQGNFIEEKNLPFRAIRFSLISDGFVFQLAPFGLDNDEEDYQIAITDKNYILKHSFIKYHTVECNPVSRTPYFFRANETVVFAPIYGRSIFSISDSNDCDMAYYVDFESPYYEPSKHFNGFKEALEQELFYTYDNPLYDGRYMIQTFVPSPSQKKTLVIDCKTNKYVLIDSLIQDNPMLYDFNFLLTKSFSNELQCFIGFSNRYYPGIHDNEIEDIKRSKSDTVASILINNEILYADNPLLILYRLNDIQNL